MAGGAVGAESGRGAADTIAARAYSDHGKMASARENMRKHADDWYSRGGQAQEIDAIMGAEGVSREEAYKRFKEHSKRVAGGALGALGAVYGGLAGGMLAPSNAKGVMLGTALGGAALGSVGLLGGRVYAGADADKTIGYHKMMQKKAAAMGYYQQKEAASTLGALKGMYNVARSGFGRSAADASGKVTSLVGGEAKRLGKSGLGGAATNVGHYWKNLAKNQPGLAASLVAAPVAAGTYALS
jgi:hypothetical protein